MLHEIVQRLDKTHSLSVDEYELLISNCNSELMSELAGRARRTRKKMYGADIFIRGLIEFTNYCKNNCLYCGIRRSNSSCTRYRLGENQILRCCERGYELGFRTFVLQGGEDPYFTDARMSRIVGDIKEMYPDCAITLSIGERSFESYAQLRKAGADRYLLRHEAADPLLYAYWHPSSMSYRNRMRCIYTLRSLDYAVGVGFMVGGPCQTSAHLAQDLKFVELFQPEMCGIGPFIPHHLTPFCQEDCGSVDLTCYLLSIIRLIKPDILLPSTTALNALHPLGLERGIDAGANVVMPNISPEDACEKYDLYDNKQLNDMDVSERLVRLNRCACSRGYRVVVDRGDKK